MAISRSKAIERIDELVEEFEYIFQNATYVALERCDFYEERYESARRETMSLLAAIWSEDEATAFDIVARRADGVFEEVHFSDHANGALIGYKAHLKDCITLLRTYRKRVQTLGIVESGGGRVDRSKRQMIDGWIDKARNQRRVAEEHLKSGVRDSECIQASQECVELSVKSILELLNIEYALSHRWAGGEFARIAKQIHDKQLSARLAENGLGHIQLPRLLLLANLWGHFYLPAKYGFSDGYLAAARDLFGKDEATLALKHARECYSAASQLRGVDEATLSAIVGSAQ